MCVQHSSEITRETTTRLPYAVNVDRTTSLGMSFLFNQRNLLSQKAEFMVNMAQEPTAELTVISGGGLRPSAVTAP